MSTFKIIVTGIFLFLAVAGVIVFATYGSTDKVAVPSVTIWGTLPTSYMEDFIHSINSHSTVVNASYIEVQPDEFAGAFVNAIAEGKGPDIVLLPDSLLYQERNKVLPIGYQTYPERDFRDTFIDAASIFISKDGVLGVPFAVDPLVMYWNRDILSSAGVARAPFLWKEFPSIGTSVISRNDSSTILRALAPLGEYRNVTNAKAILSTLFFQSGNAITTLNDVNQYVSTLDADIGPGQNGPASAVDFYTSFSNPVKPTYTWNRSLPASHDAFLSGDLALYFGFASELFNLQEKNPNLNFDVTTMPQADGATKSNYGKMYGLSIVKNGPRVASALSAIAILTNATNMQVWTDITKLPPVRRDLLTTRPKDPYLDIFYSAAIQTKTWLDPNPVTSDAIFQDMIESVTTGRNQGNSVVTLAKQKLDQALKNN